MRGDAVVLPRDGGDVPFRAGFEVPRQAPLPEAEAKEVETSHDASHQLVVVQVEHEIVARSPLPVESGGGDPCRVVCHGTGEHGTKLPRPLEVGVRTCHVGMYLSRFPGVLRHADNPPVQAFEGGHRPQVCLVDPYLVEKRLVCLFCHAERKLIIYDFLIEDLLILDFKF